MFSGSGLGLTLRRRSSHALGLGRGASPPGPYQLPGVSYEQGGYHLHTMVHMVTRNENGLVRVTVTLDPQDVDLLDRLAALEGLNRSAELRAMLAQVRPVLRATIETFERAITQRIKFDSAASRIEFSKLESLLPEIESIGNQYLGIVSKLDGIEAHDAPASNTGATL